MSQKCELKEVEPKKEITSEITIEWFVKHRQGMQERIKKKRKKADLSVLGLRSEMWGVSKL